MALNRGFSYREQIGPGGAGVTVRDHLARTYAHSDAATWDTRIAAAEVEVDGHVVAGEAILQPGQQLVWHRPPWHEPDVPLAFTVIFEDADLVAVDKPSGLPTMPAGGFLDHTLLTVVQARFGAVHPMHRLGRGTSGVVVFARTGAAASALGRAWRSRDVVKDYRALVDGVPAWDVQPIDQPIGRVAHPQLGVVHAAAVDGVDALSVASVVERRHDTTLVDVRIATGRPHQIRIHLAAVGHPLTGDPLYASGGRPRAVAPGLPGDGGYLLHARALTVTHPTTAAALRLEAPLPPALRAAAER